MPDLNQVLDDIDRLQRKNADLERQLKASLETGKAELQDVGSETIWLEGIVSGATLLPKVTIRWGLQMCQMTPQEAREHAMSILECADSAESDAFLVLFLRDKVGMQEPEKYSSILQEFREFREKARLATTPPADTPDPGQQ